MGLCPQFACLLIVYRTILVGQIFKEIKVGIVAVLHSVGAGDAYHSAGKLSKLAVFIGEMSGGKAAADGMVLLIIIAPEELCLTSFNGQTQIDGAIVHWDTGIEKFCFLPVFQMDDRQGAAPQGLAVILAQVDIVHIIVVQNETRAVLVYLGDKVHLGGDPCMDAGKLTGQDTHLVQ